MEKKGAWTKTGSISIDHMVIDEYNGFVYIAAGGRLSRICERSIDQIVKHFKKDSYLATFPQVLLELMGEYSDDSGDIELVCVESKIIRGLWVDQAGCVSWVLTTSYDSQLVTYDSGLVSPVRRFRFPDSCSHEGHERSLLARNSDGTFVILTHHFSRDVYSIEHVRLPQGYLAHTVTCEKAYPAFSSFVYRVFVDTPERIHIAGKYYVTTLEISKEEQQLQPLRYEYRGACVGITSHLVWGLQILFFYHLGWAVCDDSTILFIDGNTRSLFGSGLEINPKSPFVHCVRVGREKVYVASQHGDIYRFRVFMWDPILQQAKIILRELREAGKKAHLARLLSNGHLICL